MDKTLVDILSLRRSSNSIGEQHLIDNFIVPTGAQPDGFGNYILRVGTAPILWSCHTDTVHTQNPPVLRQKLLTTEDESKIMSDNANCLGADNGAGIWMCLELIKAGREGLYIFHREEETGGKGSKYIAKETPELLDGIKYAIAFDRRGTKSIITHQGTKTASKEFAEKLAQSLGMGHEPDDTGSFTDTASYAHLVPECTNVSAGFHNEHNYREWLDVNYLTELRDAFLKVDVTEIPPTRETTDNEYAGGYMPWWPDDDEGVSYYGSRGGAHSPSGSDYNGAYMIYNYPVKTFAILRDLGIIDVVLEELESHAKKSVIGY